MRTVEPKEARALRESSVFGNLETDTEVGRGQIDVGLSSNMPRYGSFGIKSIRDIRSKNL